MPLSPLKLFELVAQSTSASTSISTR